VTNRIIFGQTGQTLRHIPTGVASAATFVFEDIEVGEDNADRVIAEGAATVASWTLTTNAAAGVTQSNAKRISVTATTGAALAVPAVIVASNGTRERFEVGAIASGSYIEAASPLAGEYASGSTVYGLLMTASVPDDFAADEDGFKLGHALRVTWVYTVGGLVVRVPELVEFVRHNVGADQFVGEVSIRLRKLYPQLAQTLGDDIDFDAIVSLMADEVADDLRAKGIAPERFMIGQRGRRLLEARVLMHAGIIGYAPGQTEQATWAARAEHQYQAQLSSATIGEPGHATAETDADTDTAASTPKYRGLTLEM
jgi:hypothetical protein